jgi:hypothetical protein
MEVGDHLRALERHIGRSIVDLVIANDAFPPLEEDSLTRYVSLGKGTSTPTMTLDLVDKSRPWRHDSDKLANALMSLH